MSFLAVVVLTAALGAGAAAADCAGPTVDHDGGNVAVGDVVTIRGFAFGNNCYDTGPPPPGEGVLGVPQSDLSLVLSDGVTEVVVATGNADGDYEFVVQVQIPFEFDQVGNDLELSVTQGGQEFVFFNQAARPFRLGAGQGSDIINETPRFGPAEPAVAVPLPVDLGAAEPPFAGGDAAISADRWYEAAWVVPLVVFGVVAALSSLLFVRGGRRRDADA